MGRMQRDKGARGEREVAELFREAGYLDARRTGQYQSQDAGVAPDVSGTPFWIEVKRQVKCYPLTALEQAATEWRDRRADFVVPLAVTKQDRGQWWVCLYHEHLQAAIQRRSPGDLEAAPVHLYLSDFFYLTKGVWL